MNGWEWLRGIAPVSLCDWPEHVCSVLFFGGCNLRCPTCHNQAIAWRPKSLPALSKDETMENLLTRRTWLDGIVVTGGEASIVPGIENVFEDLRVTGLPIKLDSNGMRPDLVRRFLEQGLVDCFAVDVKGPWAKYPSLTGNRIEPDSARANLEAIFAMATRHPGRFYFRCTRVPGLTESDLARTRSYLPEGFDLTLQNYIEPPEQCCPEDESITMSGCIQKSDFSPGYDHA
jgi:pyruvate formate lyase activating enzyme